MYATLLQDGQDKLQLLSNAKFTLVGPSLYF